MEYRVKNLFLCKVVWNSNRRRHGQKSKLDVILEDIQSSNSFSDEEISQIRQKLINNFFPQFNRQWTRVTRNKSLFLQKYETFLQKDFVVVFNRNARNTKVDENRCVRTPKVGRPRVNYEEGSVKTKRRRIQDIAMNYSAEELKRALELINLPVDDDSASDVEDEVDSNKVLAMYSDLSLTVDKYRKLRLHNEQLFGKKIYPPYRKIQAAKVNCYPEHIDITDLGAKVDFISLIDHTVRRILLINFQESDLEKLQNKKLFLLGKWGMDGASGQQTTRQKWSNSLRYQLSDADDAVLSSTINRFNNNNKSDNEYDSENNDVYDDNATKQMKISDETVFMVSMVPLQLKADDSIIWENETPSSIHWCRPVEFNFTKETHEIVIATYEKYENLLKKVELYYLKIGDMEFYLSFNMKCTMIDGKICNILTENKASSRCNICGVGPKLMNDLNHVITRKCNEEFYKFGMSTLHAWIRSLEYLLHIAYNLDFRKSAARTFQEKELKKKRKQFIQRKLKSELSLTVDVVKQGSGTTNTGNVARSFFENAQTVARITGLNESLIERFHNIMQTITCNKMIDSGRFKIYALDTANLCVELYPWYKMPPTVHKILIHGSSIVKSFNVPMGYFSEEPQEANNKVFRRARLTNCRMTDRISTNNDIIHHLMISSDPLINSMRIKEKRRTKELSAVAETLLQ